MPPSTMQGAVPARWTSARARSAKIHLALGGARGLAGPPPVDGDVRAAWGHARRSKNTIIIVVVVLVVRNAFEKEEGEVSKGERTEERDMEGRGER